MRSLPCSPKGAVPLARSIASSEEPGADKLDITRPDVALYGCGGTPKLPFARVASFKLRVAPDHPCLAGDS